MEGGSGAAIVLIVMLGWYIALFTGIIVICFQKDKPVFAVLGILGLFIFTVIGAIRIAKPHSTWAQKHYEPGGPKMELAFLRFSPKIPSL